MIEQATAKRERLRAVLAGDACVRPASVFDPLSARMAEDIGFEAGILAGSTASLAVLGEPDNCVLTLSEFAGLARRICRAGNLPLLVDADHGYGNALNVRRTVEELETAGVAALTIEDTELPAAFGEPGRRGVIPLDEAIGKMKAALDARQDPALIVAGRTSAIGLTSVADAIERCTGFQEAGVDAIFLSDIPDREALTAVAAKIDLPIMIGKAPPDVRDRNFLESIGVRFDQQTHKPMLAGVRATYETLKMFRDGAGPWDLDYYASDTLMRQLSRADDRDRLSQETLARK